MTRIFVSVGTQAPFPRLINYAEELLLRRPEYVAFAQIGPVSQVPSGIPSAQFIDEELFASHLASADLFITHAGMGNIIRALEQGIPAVVVPRRSELGEHVNDHQVDTLAEFGAFPGIFSCDSDHAFEQAVTAALAYERVDQRAGAAERDALMSAVSAFLRT